MLSIRVANLDILDLTVCLDLDRRVFLSGRIQILIRSKQPDPDPRIPFTWEAKMLLKLVQKQDYFKYFDSF